MPRLAFLPAASHAARSVALAATASALLAVGGCGTWSSVQQRMQTSDSFLGVITPYRVEIVQGNVVTQEQAAQIKPGMRRAQVRDVLGSPLLTDMFHADRWDYYFAIKRQGAQPQQRNITAWFEGDTLKSLDVPPDLPTERDFVASISTIKPKDKQPVLELTEAQRQALPVPPKPEPAASAPAEGATRVYPPLETR